MHSDQSTSVTYLFGVRGPHFLSKSMKKSKSTEQKVVKDQVQNF